MVIFHFCAPVVLLFYELLHSRKITVLDKYRMARKSIHQHDTRKFVDNVKYFAAVILLGYVVQVLHFMVVC
jgi:hypothetical protein